MLVKTFAAAVLLCVASCSSGSQPNTANSAKNKKAGATSTTAAKCKGWGSSDSSFVGQPKNLKNGGQSGYYVWWDTYTGWHVRVVDPSPTPLTFSGSVSGLATVGVTVAPNPSDFKGSVLVKAGRFEFTVPGQSAQQGFDFGAGCATKSLRFELNGPGGPVPTESIFVGATGHANANPVVVERKP